MEGHWSSDGYWEQPFSERGPDQHRDEPRKRRFTDGFQAKAVADELRGQLNPTTRPLLKEPRILDADTTIKPRYGEQEGAVVSCKPHKPCRPSHSYHSYLGGGLRLMLEVEVQFGNQHTPRQFAPDLELAGSSGSGRQPVLVLGDNGWGVEAAMREAEQRRHAYSHCLWIIPCAYGVRAVARRARAFCCVPAAQLAAST